MTQHIDYEQVLRRIVHGTGGSLGEDFFRCLSRDLAETLGVGIAFVAEHDQRDPFRARLLALWEDGRWVGPMDYDIRGTPCEKVFEEGMAYYGSGVQERFPDDTWLRNAGVDSYLAIPLIDGENRPVGHLGVMHHEPLSSVSHLVDVLRIFASRAAAEVRRIQADEKLKKAQSELEERVRQRTYELTSLLETATDAIITIGEDSCILYVNGATERIFGYRRDELVGQKVTLLTPVSTRPRHLAGIRRFVETGERTVSWQAQEFTALHKDGREVQVEVSLGAIKDKSGKYRFTAIVRDVTERKRMEAQLEQREAQLKLITDSLPAFISYADTEYRYRFVNAEYERYCGISRGEILGKTFREVWGEAMYESVREHLQATVHGERRTVQLHLPPSRGIRRHVQVDLVPHRDSSGQVVGYYVLGSDISDRVAAEEALQEQLEFERLISDLSSGLVRTPHNQIDVEINRALGRLGEHFRVDRCAIVQVSEEDQTPRPTHVWTSHRVKPGQNTFPQVALSRMVEAWRRGDSWMFSSWLEELPAEERRTIESLGIKSTLTVPLKVGERLFGGMGISSFTEERSWNDQISERLRLLGEIFANAISRKYVEEQIQRHQAELAHVSRLNTLGEMAAGLAHELNQPLTAIAAFADGALIRLRKNELCHDELTKVIERISSDALRAGEIIRRLRRFAQKRDPVRTAVDVNAIVRDACQFLESELVQKSVLLELDLADDLVQAQADPVEIQQVLLNLLRNAIEAVTDPSAEKQAVKIVTKRRDPRNVEVVVEDSGSGIPREVREQVFEPFYTSKDQGLGLGLAITRTVLQANGGRIWIEESRLGGTSVGFSLQIAREDHRDVK